MNLYKEVKNIKNSNKRIKNIIMVLRKLNFTFWGRIYTSVVYKVYWVYWSKKKKKNKIWKFGKKNQEKSCLLKEKKIMVLSE